MNEQMSLFDLPGMPREEVYNIPTSKTEGKKRVLSLLLLLKPPAGSALNSSKI